MQDVVEALITHLKTVSAVTTLVSTRIWGGDIQRAEITSMPRKNIVITESGRPEEFRTHTVQRQRVDIYSYGESYYQAGRVDRAVADALMAISRTTANSTLIHSVGYSGRISLKIPESGWEYYMRSAMIYVGETAVA